MATNTVAPAVAETYCFRCQHYPQSGDSPLKRCGRCRARHYCSRDCQELDWRSHKKECAAIAAGGPVPNRVVTRMRFMLGGEGPSVLEAHNAPGGVGPSSSNDTIYYLKTTRRWLNDITLSGPYMTFNDVAEQVHGRLKAEKSADGPRAFDEILMSQPGGVPSINFFHAVVPDGNMLRFDFLQETNAEVAQQRNGPFYMVRSVVPQMDASGLPARGNLQNGETFGQVTETEPLRTFLDETSAISYAKSKAEELKRDKGGKVYHQNDVEESCPFAATVFSAGGIEMIQVFRDDGVLRDPATYSMI